MVAVFVTAQAWQQGLPQQVGKDSFPSRKIKGHTFTGPHHGIHECWKSDAWWHNPDKESVLHTPTKSQKRPTGSGFLGIRGSEQQGKRDYEVSHLFC